MSFAPRPASAVAIPLPSPPVAPVRSAVLAPRTMYRNVPVGDRRYLRTAKTSSALLAPYRSKNAYPHLVEADPTTEGLP
jgi:hypothetical protein